MSALLCSLEPDLNFVAIRIGDVGVGKAGSERATTEQAPPAAFDFGDGTVDVVGVHEPKAEMRDAPPETGPGGVLGEGEDVVPTRRLSVNEPISAPVLTQTEDLLVESQRASQVAHREIDMRKAVGLNHAYLERAYPPRRTYRCNPSSWQSAWSSTGGFISGSVATWQRRSVA